MLKVYGCSDDLVEIDGTKTQYDEIGCFNSDVLIEFTDGTTIRVHYGKGEKGIWYIEILSEGAAIVKFIECMDEDAAIYSDILEIDAEVKSVTLENQD